jgi:hypothetical protein
LEAEIAAAKEEGYEVVEHYQGLSNRGAPPDTEAFDFTRARRSHSGVNESNPWVRAHRQSNFALGAGPSATTLSTLAVAGGLYGSGKRQRPNDNQRNVLMPRAWGYSPSATGSTTRRWAAGGE